MATATVSRASNGRDRGLGRFHGPERQPGNQAPQSRDRKQVRRRTRGGEQNAEGRDGGRVGREAENFGLRDGAAGERRDQRVDGECVEKEGEADPRRQADSKPRRLRMTPVQTSSAACNTNAIAK